MYILSRVFFSVASLNFYTLAKETLTFCLFPPFGHFLEGKYMFLSVTPEWIYLIEAACVFNGSQHLDEKEKEQWDGTNDKSAEGCTKDDFNSTEFPSRPPPLTHTGAHILDKTARRTHT